MSDGLTNAEKVAKLSPEQFERVQQRTAQMQQDHAVGQAAYRMSSALSQSRRRRWDEEEDDEV